MGSSTFRNSYRHLLFIRKKTRHYRNPIFHYFQTFNLPVRRHTHSALTVSDTEVIFFGGSPGNHPTRMDKYDTATDSWETVGHLPSGREGTPVGTCSTFNGTHILILASLSSAPRGLAVMGFDLSSRSWGTPLRLSGEGKKAADWGCYAMEQDVGEEGSLRMVFGGKVVARGAGGGYTVREKDYTAYSQSVVIPCSGLGQDKRIRAFYMTTPCCTR